MTQLTPAQLEKIVNALPTTGNGDWSARQKVVSRHDGVSTATSVSEVAILGPADKHVGDFVRLDPATYRPHSGVPYWYIRQMHEAGWQETDGMIGLVKS